MDLLYCLFWNSRISLPKRQKHCQCLNSTGYDYTGNSMHSDPSKNKPPALSVIINYNCFQFKLKVSVTSKHDSKALTNFCHSFHYYKATMSITSWNDKFLMHALSDAFLAKYAWIISLVLCTAMLNFTNWKCTWVKYRWFETHFLKSVQQKMSRSSVSIDFSLSLFV